MSTLSLHLPVRRGLTRWGLSGLTVLAAHLAIAAAAIVWYTHVPPQPNTIPAIAVSLVPVTSAPAPQHEDVAIGQPMQQADDTPPPEPAKIEQQQPVEEVAPPPVQQAEVTLPKPEPKPQPKPEPAPKPRHEPKPVAHKRPAPPRPPAQETRAPPKAERAARFSEAGATAYNSQVFGHLQRFKRYPDAADGVIGVAVVRFGLNRAGQVISAAITKSSGHPVLDREALAIVHRASPFPAFPAEKPGAQDAFIAPINFAR